MEILKLLSAHELVAQIVNFLLLLVILRFLLWKPLLAALEARRQKIISENASIALQKTQLDTLKRSYEEKLLNIEQDAKKRIQQAALEGKSQAEKITQDAHRQAQMILEQARLDIKYELGAAKEELKEKIVDLSLRATQSLIQNKLTEADDLRLVEDFLNRVDELE